MGRCKTITIRFVLEGEPIEFVFVRSSNEIKLNGRPVQIKNLDDFQDKIKAAMVTKIPSYFETVEEACFYTSISLDILLVFGHKTWSKIYEPGMPTKAMYEVLLWKFYNKDDLIKDGYSYIFDHKTMTIEN